MVRELGLSPIRYHLKDIPFPYHKRQHAEKAKTAHAPINPQPVSTKKLD